MRRVRRRKDGVERGGCVGGGEKGYLNLPGKVS